MTGIETTETFFDTAATGFSTNQKSISASEFVQGATFEYYLCINTSETTPVEVGLMLIDTDNTSKICNTQIQGSGDTLVKIILKVVSVTDDTTTKFFWSGYIFGDTTPIIDDENVTTPDRSKNTNFYPRLYANAGQGGNNNDLTIKNFYFRRIC